LFSNKFKSLKLDPWSLGIKIIMIVFWAANHLQLPLRYMAGGDILYEGFYLAGRQGLVTW